MGNIKPISNEKMRNIQEREKIANIEKQQQKQDTNAKQDKIEITIDEIEDQ